MAGLPQEQLGAIQNSLAQLEQAQTELEMAKRAGLHELPGGETLAKYEEQVASLKASLLRIKNVYFPNTP